MKIKKSLAVITILLASSTFAVECPSVDITFKKFDVGLVSQKDISNAISCNIDKYVYKSGLCKTRIGLKKDNLDFQLKAYNVGLVTKADVDEARNQLEDIKQICD